MNRRLASGVWLNEAVMDVLAGDLAGSLVSSDTLLQREFEQRLADCPTLAYRGALGVLRNRAEAEDVAQEAMLRAYRNFHRLRDRDRFRAWLVRTAWRLSLDRIRASGRRERRERMSMENHAGTSAEMTAGRELERQVAAALDDLPEKLRMVMVLAVIVRTSHARKRSRSRNR
jgi:RNA polymerase sigma-70 factor, ECF subfamily